MRRFRYLWLAWSVPVPAPAGTGLLDQAWRCCLHLRWGTRLWLLLAALLLGPTGWPSIVRSQNGDIAVPAVGNARDSAPTTGSPTDNGFAAQLLLSGSPDGLLTDGAVLRLEAPPTSLTIERVSAGAVVLSFGTPDHETSLSLASADDAPLTVGRYEPVQRFGFAEGRPGLAISTRGRSCEEVGGAFEIEDIAYGDDGHLVRLDVTLRHRCDAELVVTRGRLTLRALPPTVTEP